MADWYLEGYLGEQDKLIQFHLINLPQTLGREQNLTLTVSAPSISRNHARFDVSGQFLTITDLASSNGTFVNHERVYDTTPLKHGDVLHFGLVEMRVIDKHRSNQSSVPIEENATESTRVMSISSLSTNFPSGINELERLITNKAVQMVYQPIIDAKTLKTCGYEVLGRGASNELPASPLTLFTIAESFNLEVKLSQMMRNIGIDLAVQHALQGDILVNTHPAELNDVDALLKDLVEMRRRHPELPVTLEIHEQAVTENKSQLSDFSKELANINIRLAFDDFGVGQSRIMELVDAKPQLIKFDRVLIDKIDTADKSRVNLLKHLKDLAADLGIATLAECVGTEGEYKTCETMGFDFYQGFYFGKPVPPQDC